jgi:hypothetical protein
MPYTHLLARHCHRVCRPPLLLPTRQRPSPAKRPRTRHAPHARRARRSAAAGRRSGRAVATGGLVPLRPAAAAVDDRAAAAIGVGPSSREQPRLLAAADGPSTAPISRAQRRAARRRAARHRAAAGAAAGEGQGALALGAPLASEAAQRVGQRHKPRGAEQSDGPAENKTAANAKSLCSQSDATEQVRAIRREVQSVRVQASWRGHVRRDATPAASAQSPCAGALGKR